MIEKGRVISLISSAAGLAVLFAIAAFVKSKAIKLICDTAALVLSVVTFMTPGVLVHICLLSNMHCQVRLKPFTRGSAIFIALLALWDILRIIKENKEKGPGEEE